MEEFRARPRGYSRGFLFFFNGSGNLRFRGGFFFGNFFFPRTRAFPGHPGAGLVLGWFWFFWGFFSGKGELGNFALSTERGRKGFRKTRKIGMDAAFPADFREGKSWRGGEKKKKKNPLFPLFFGLFLAEAMSKTPNFSGNGNGNGITQN